MPTPFSLSDDEYAAVQAAAAPIHPQQRDAFLKASRRAGALPRGRPWCCVPSRLGAAKALCRPARTETGLARRRSARSRADAALLHDHRRAVLAMQAAFLIALRFILH
jgi:hypothetical protein